MASQGRKVFFGNSGNELYVGGTGNDVLFGGMGSDTLMGEQGNDVIFGGSGADSILGGEGNDILFGGSGADTILGGGGVDVLLGGSGIDELDGGAGRDVIFGGSGSDKVAGDIGNDILFGGSGDDEIKGGSGRDIIFGNSGDDTFFGGEGDDILFGGSGADVFYLDAGSIGEGVDKIVDFRASWGDRLGFEAVEGTFGDAAELFRIGGSSYITDIWFDRDGSGDAYEFEHAVRLLGSHAFDVESMLENGSLFVDNLSDTPPEPELLANDDVSNTDEFTPVVIDVLANDENVSDSATIISFTQPAQGIVSLNAEGAFVFDPTGHFDMTAEESATVSFEYTVQDSEGNTSTAEVTVDVQGLVNIAPDAVNDAATTDAATDVTIDVLANDTDPDAVSPLLTITSFTQPDAGTITLNPDSTFTFSPSSSYDSLFIGETEVATFTYTVTDVQGLTDTASVEITVSGLVDPNEIVALPDEGATNESTAITVDVLANDANRDGATEGLFIASVEQPEHGGVVTLNADNTITFDPNGAYDTLNGGQNAEVVINYTVENAQGYQATESMTINVGGISEAGSITSDTNQMLSNGQTLGLTLTSPETSHSDAITVSGILHPGAVSHAQYNIAFLLDTSSRARSSFDGADVVGDINNDGNAGSVLDAQIAAFQSLNQSIIDSGLADQVKISVISVTSGANTIGVFTPGGDVDAALASITAGGSRNNLSAGLQEAITFFNDRPEANNLLYVASHNSFNPVSPAIVDELHDTQGVNATSIAVRVGDGAMQTVELIDNTGTAERALNFESLTESLLSAPVDSAAVESVDLYVNGALHQTIGGDSLTPFFGGLAFNDITLEGVDTGAGTQNVIEAVASVQDGDDLVTLEIEHVVQSSFDADALITPIAVKDKASILSDSVSVLDVLSNDIDPDADDADLVLTAVNQPSHGTITQNADGTLTFDPGADFDDLASGQGRQVTFTYEVTDADNQTTTGTVELAVYKDVITDTELLVDNSADSDAFEFSSQPSQVDGNDALLSSDTGGTDGGDASLDSAVPIVDDSPLVMSTDLSSDSEMFA